MTTLNKTGLKLNMKPEHQCSLSYMSCCGIVHIQDAVINLNNIY